MTIIALKVAYLGQPLVVQVDSTQLVYDGERFVPAATATKVVLVTTHTTSALAPQSYDVTNTPVALTGSIPNQAICGVLSSVTLTGTPESVVQAAPPVSGSLYSLMTTQVQGVSIVVFP